MENKNKLITTMQTLILVFGFFYLIEARVMFRYYNATTLLYQIIYFLSWAFLIFATIRMLRKSLRKWEAILYFILDIICVALIVYSVFYVGVTYEDFLGEEDSGLGYMFMMILCGIPYAGITAILSIVSIVKIAFTKTKNKATENTIETIREIETTMQENKELIKKENQEDEQKIEYCSYCGKKIKSNANFCKYCGNKRE